AKKIGRGWGRRGGHCKKRGRKNRRSKHFATFVHICPARRAKSRFRSKLAGIMNTIVWLSQIQSLVSLGFTSLFLLIELGLAWVLLFFRLADRYSPGNAWMLAYRFWVRVYALAAILALAASMPVLIQLGSLWPGLLDRIGDVAGPRLAAAILTAFIVKSCFMSAMLFGQRSVSDAVYTAVVLMVAVGTTLAVLWVVALVGWMQTPAGTGFVNGEYFVVDWYQVVFNPSTGWLFLLMVAASGLTVAFMMLGVIAGRASSLPADDSGRQVFRTGAVIGLAAVLAYGVGITGYGRMVATHQPAKAAATAAYWQSGVQPDLALFGWPDERRGATRALVTWEHAGGRWLGRDADGRLLGLDHFSGMHPPVAFTFWSFRLALAAAIAMLAAACGALWCTKRKYIEHGD